MAEAGRPTAWMRISMACEELGDHLQHLLENPSSYIEMTAAVIRVDMRTVRVGGDGTIFCVTAGRP